MDEPKDPIDATITFIVQTLHPRGDRLSRREIEEIFTSALIVFWVVVAPIATFLGYVQYISIDSPERFWFFILFGVINIGIASVPIPYVWDPVADEFVNLRTGERMSRRKVLITRSLMRGIGVGLICYAMGGAISQAWTLYEFLGVLVGGPAAVKAFIDIVREPRKYRDFG